MDGEGRQAPTAGVLWDDAQAQNPPVNQISVLRVQLHSVLAGALSNKEKL